MYADDMVKQEAPLVEEYVSGDVGHALILHHSYLAPLNVVAKEDVDKLLLSSEQHLQLSSLAWIERGSSMTVDRRVLVVGDVVPMDACHLLLGKPWQFDCSAAHDGRLSSYTFMFEGVKIVLLPTLSRAVFSTTSSPVLLLSRATFVDEMREALYVFILYCPDASDDRLPPSDVRHLLEKFADVFPENLPSSLPPLRDI
ncbi:gag-pol polyprotein [Striga asiatica]|uniref:Gag-pol polyprotein n=1 Tax=Striga asiatica TaxID=4170 RepID=A0A5A7PS84_STRAF|nr:gag-pol polyprotein [Striga asiatica]